MLKAPHAFVSASRRASSTVRSDSSAMTGTETASETCRRPSTSSPATGCSTAAIRCTPIRSIASTAVGGRPGAVRVHAQVDVLAEHPAQQLERVEIALEVVADLDLHLPDSEGADHERERDELARRRERDDGVVAHLAGGRGAEPPLHGGAEVLAAGVEERELERAARGQVELGLRGVDGLLEGVRHGARVVDRGAEQRRREPVGERGERALDRLAGDVLPRHALAPADAPVREREPHEDVRRRVALGERVPEREAEGQLHGQDVDVGDEGHRSERMALSCGGRASWRGRPSIVWRSSSKSRMCPNSG